MGMNLDLSLLPHQILPFSLFLHIHLILTHTDFCTAPPLLSISPNTIHPPLLFKTLPSSSRAIVHCSFLYGDSGCLMFGH